MAPARKFRSRAAEICRACPSLRRERKSSIAAATAANPRAASFATIGIRLCATIFPGAIEQPRRNFRPANIHANEQLIPRLRCHDALTVSPPRHPLAELATFDGSLTVTGDVPPA